MANITLSEIIQRNNERFRKMVFETSDENALRYPMLYAEWKQGESYIANQRVRFGEKLWRVKRDLIAENEPAENDDYEKVVAKN